MEVKLNCIEDFKNEYQKLIKNNSYKSLSKYIIDSFFKDNKVLNLEELDSAVRINNNKEIPFIKARLGGSSGFRIYYYLIKIKGECYLVHVYPKTGKKGQSNITPKLKKEIYSTLLMSIKQNRIYAISVSDDNKKIIFTKKIIEIA